jgi:hypothetical protein
MFGNELRVFAHTSKKGRFTLREPTQSKKIEAGES